MQNFTSLKFSKTVLLPKQTKVKALSFRLAVKKNTLLLGLILLLVVHKSLAADWYVNDASRANDVYTTAVGNDANPGTTPAPFATLTQALLAASAGDVIYVDAGTYVTVGAGVFYDIKIPITILGAMAGVDPRPCVNSTRIPGSTSETIFDGNNVTGAVFFINTVAASNVTIDGLDIRNSTARCINSDAAVKTNILIKNCIIGNSSDDAMQLQNIANSTIEYNYIWNTPAARVPCNSVLLFTSSTKCS